MARTNVYCDVEVALCDTAKSVVYLLKVADDNTLDQNVDEYEESRENDDLHKNAGVERGITHKGCLGLGHCGKYAIALDEGENVHVPYTRGILADTAFYIIVVKRVIKNAGLHLLRRSDSYYGNVLVGVVCSIADDVKVLVKHGDESAGANVAILCYVNNELVKHIVELLGIVTDLNKSAGFKIYRRVFSPDGFVLASWGIFLYEFILFL